MKIFLLLFFLTELGFAQVIDAPVNPIDYQQNPPHIEWKQIETEHFQLIFPAEISESAQRAAHLLETSYPFVTRSMKEQPPRIPLVLQTQGTISNAFVTLAPRRSEFYVTPAVDPELTNTEWLKTLSVHEFRHVVQFQKGRRGFNKALYIVMGEIGQALGLAFTAPPWFYEGDAVGTETALTRGGRGRLPVFDRDIRTLLLSGQMYSYDKAHMGSYINYIPNHYYWGYFYTTYLRNHYGDDFLARAMNLSAETSWNPLSFYHSLDKLLPEKSFEKFYKHCMQELLSLWQERLNKIQPTPYEVKNPEKKWGWTNYHYPQMTRDGKIVALKRGLSFIEEFVLLEGNKEEHLFYPGSLNQEFPFKLRKDRIAFMEVDLDPRWGYRNYNRLRVYDVKDDEFVLDVRKTKLRVPALNHTADKIVAVEWDDKQNQSLVILDKKGEEIFRHPYPHTEVITSIDWLDDENLVMVVKDRMDLKRLSTFNLNSKDETNLVAPQMTNLGFVTVNEGKILIESPESGIDNIYLVDNGLKQMTSSAYGSYAPMLVKDKLIYNEYTALGMTVAEKKAAWNEEQSSSGSFLPYYEKFASSENFQLLNEALEKPNDYEVTKYSQPAHALNLHSWLVIAPPLSNTVTVQAYSRDILNKFSLNGGYSYNINEQTHTGFVGAAWSHLYPVIDLRAAYGGRRQNFSIGGREVDNRWEEGTAELGASVPWKKIYGRFTSKFSLRAFAKIIQVTNKLSRDVTEVSDGTLFSPGAELSFDHLSKTALRDIQPPWGVSLLARAEEGKDISGVDQKGAIRSLDSRWYIPGFFKHHNFYQQLAYEKQRDAFYQYESALLYPRGTRSFFLTEFTKYSANYTFPLAYPEWYWPRYLYLKRIYMNLFYDNLNGRFTRSPYNASSAGWESVFEINFLRIVLPLQLGVRGSYPITGKQKTNNYELFIASTLGEF
jgi:hypothetical protein